MRYLSHHMSYCRLLGFKGSCLPLCHVADITIESKGNVIWIGFIDDGHESRKRELLFINMIKIRKVENQMRENVEEMNE